MFLPSVSAVLTLSATLFLLIHHGLSRYAKHCKNHGLYIQAYEFRQVSDSYRKSSVSFLVFALAFLMLDGLLGGV